MTVIQATLSLLIPCLLWLVFGGPDLSNSANIVFFGIVVFHLYVVIWQRVIFKWLSGDFYTYGAANFAINLVSFLYTLLFSLLLFHRSALFEMLFGSAYYPALRDVPKILLGLAIAGTVVTLSLAVFTSTRLSKLPRKEDRRSFEPPGKGGI